MIDSQAVKNTCNACIESKGFWLAEWDAELNQLHERNGDLGLEVQNLKEELATVTRSREENKNSAPTVAEFPEPAGLLDQLKAQRKKSRADLADIEVIIELLNQAGSSF